MLKQAMAGIVAADMKIGLSWVKSVESVTFFHYSCAFAGLSNNGSLS